METHTWYTENGANDDIWRLVGRGSDGDLAAFGPEFNFGSVRICDLEWIYSLAAFHDVELLEFTANE